MEFNKENHTVETLMLGEETLTFRAYRALTYVEKPVCEEYQRMNIFAPEAYYRGESINGYSQHTAPAAMFPAYVNSLALRDETGNELTLASDGEGSFKEYVKSIVLDSANKAIAKDFDLSGKFWLTIENDKSVNIDWEGYVRDITRLKNAPSFDDLTLRSGENDLFGSTEGQCRHFTEYALKNSLVNGAMADLKEVKMLNPMCYVADTQAVKAKHFRIRHGECDRDTSLAISAMFVLKLREVGIDADYHAPWNVPHAGDYDLDELFAWIDELVKA